MLYNLELFWDVLSLFEPRLCLSHINRIWLGLRIIWTEQLLYLVKCLASFLTKDFCLLINVLNQISPRVKLAWKKN
jgi:hypothetical protein